jgi:hypothetical protein
VSAKKAEKHLIEYFEGGDGGAQSKSKYKRAKHANADVTIVPATSSTTSSSSAKGSSSSRRVTVCLVDELDFMITRDENVVYNFFNWPLLKGSGMLLIGVSNTLDLPERFSQR